MIYGLIELGDESAIKIGHTSASVESRLAALQIGNWRELACVAVMPGRMRDEARLHREFAHYHLHGEWFLNHGEVALWVAEWALTSSSRTTYTAKERTAIRQSRASGAARARANASRNCKWPARCECAQCKRRRIAFSTLGRAA